MKGYEFWMGDVYIKLFRFIVEGLFTYLYLNKDKMLKANVSKRWKLFILAYAGFMSLYSYMFGDMGVRLIAVVIMYLYALVSSQCIDRSKFYLIYVFFINLIIELASFVSFELVGNIPHMFSNVINFPVIPLNMLKVTVNFVWVLMLFVIYKCDLIHIHFVHKFSDYKSITAVVVMVLMVITYIKYYTKQFYDCVHTERFGLVLSNFLLVITVMFFLIIIETSTLNKKQNQIKNREYEAKFENNIFKDNMFKLIDIDFQEYVFLRRAITEKINRCGIYDSRQGFYDIVLAIIIIKCNLKDERVVLSKNVYPIISKITGNSVKLIDTNIRNAIKESWLRTDPDILDEEYAQPVDADKGYPTAREFLMYIANEVSPAVN